MEKKSVSIIILTIICLALLVLGIMFYLKNSQLNSKISSLTNEKAQLTTQIAGLNSQINNLTSQVSILTAKIDELTNQKSNVCVKDNSCKFRTPGSGWRCNANGSFNGDSGAYWCECSIECEVMIN